MGIIEKRQRKKAFIAKKSPTYHSALVNNNKDSTYYEICMNNFSYEHSKVSAYTLSNNISFVNFTIFAPPVSHEVLPVTKTIVTHRIFWSGFDRIKSYWDIII